MERGTVTFLPLAVVIVLAFLVPLVLARLKWLTVPFVVGELVAA